MYITSDLWGPPTLNDRHSVHNTSTWNTMSDTQHTIGLGKRKRTVTDAEPDCSHTRHRRSPSSPWDQSPSSKPHFQHAHSADRRPVKQLKRLPPKLALFKSTSHLMDLDVVNFTPVPKNTTSSIAPLSHTPTSTAAPQPPTDLRSCHVCSSAPRRKKELENYLDCQSCSGRTCYICARECLGGCTRKVCKACVVEVGEEGEAWCLGCFERNGGA